MGHRAHGNLTRIHGRLLSKATGLMSTTVCSSVAHSRNTSCCESHAHFHRNGRSKGVSDDLPGAQDKGGSQPHTYV